MNIKPEKDSKKSNIVYFRPENTFEEDRDIYEMDAQELKAYLEYMLEKLSELDAKEPKNINSEKYEDWADEHEELEDFIDDIKDRLDELE